MLHKFNASLALYHVLFVQDTLGSQAHVMILGRQEIIPVDEAHAIHQALDDIKQELIDGLHPFDEAHEDIHMFVAHLLIQKFGDVGKKLHTGRSRNGQVALDLRLHARDADQKMIEQLMN